MRKFVICAFIALILAISCNGQEFKVGAMFTPQLKFQKHEKPTLEKPFFLAVSISFLDEKLVLTPIFGPLEGGSAGSFLEFKIVKDQELSAYALVLKNFQKEEGETQSPYVGFGISKSLIKDFVYPFFEVGSPTSKLHPEFFAGVTLQVFKKFKKEHK